MTQALADIVNYYIHDLQEDDIILYQQLYQPQKISGSTNNYS
jgi:hypothetical protein